MSTPAPSSSARTRSSLPGAGFRIPFAEILQGQTWKGRSDIKKKLLIFILILVILAPLAFLFHPNNRNLRRDALPVLRETVPPTLEKVYWKLARQLRGQYPGPGDTRYVEDYVALNREYRQVAAQLQREQALGNPDAETEGRLARVGRELEAVRPYAEAVVEQQVAATAREEGLVLAGGRVLPPPKFLFANSYYILVTSPRREIRIDYTQLLGRDLPLAERQRVEIRVEEDNPDLAALVLPVGGLAVFYPAQIYFRGDLVRLLDLCVHEWLHQYLFAASPLGRAYLKGSQMRTINETIANMLGRELGERLYASFYGTSEEAAAMEESYREYLREVADRPFREPLEEKEEETGFVFSRFMRLTYLEANRLLEEGDIDAAETYMEERRLLLLQEGYSIRRLNQAYFAFFGTYADSPTAVDSIGPALAQLRLQTPTAADFLAIVKGIASYQDFLTVMEEQGIPVPGT